MKITNQISSHLRRFFAACLALAALILQPLHAATTWNGGGGADTTVTNDLNWGGTVNALDGTQPASFASGGASAALNVNAKFKTLTFNKVGGFTINGPGSLIVSNATSSTTANLIVSSAQGDGTAVINTPFFLDTGSSGTKLMVINNNAAAVTAGPSLIFSNTFAATVPANTFQFRFIGTGTTKFVGAVSNCTAIQAAVSGGYSGTNIFAGNQALGSATVNIPGTTTANSSATARFQMGETTSDIQSWASTIVSQLGTVAINSSATLSGGIGIDTATSSGASGGILEVNGNLSATTLGIGSSVYTGIMKIGGTATFSGAITTGSSVGSKIVGNGAASGTLVLSSGTVGSGLTLGGANPNENSLILVKTNSGTLTLGGTHSYTNVTLVKAGRLDLTGSIASSITVSNGASLGGEGSTTGSLTLGAGTVNVYFDPTTPGVLSANSIDASAGTVVVNPSASGDGVVLQSVTPIVGSIGANFILASRAGTLSFDPTGTQLLFTNGVAAAANLKWVGASANPTFWDSAITLNWTNGAIADRFFTGDNVQFDDSASSFAVAVQGGVTAGNLLFSNTANAYTISGGSIGGSGSFTKYGTNVVFVTNNVANTFTGGLTNNAGKLVFNNLNQLGSLTPAITLSGGTLTYAGTVNALDNNFKLNITASGGGVETLATNANAYLGRGKVSGSGDWFKSGPGWLLLGVNSDTSPGNDFSGKLTVTGGLVDIRHADSLGTTAGITEVQGAILQIQNFSQTSGSTVSVPEPLVFSGTSYLQAQNQEAKTFTDQFTGPITNQAGGTLTIATGVTVSNAVLTLDLTGGIETGAGSTLVFGRRTGLTAAAVNYIAGAGQIINVTAAITGAGAVTTESPTNTAVFTLSAANTYTGDTTINGGTLSLGGTGSIANSPVITVNTNGILEVTGASFVLGSGQTLKGNGSINGDVTANGTIVPGTSVGTLTFSNNLTINSNLVVELNKSFVRSNDFINVIGTLSNTGTGTLTVSNLGPALVVGDKFTLFSQAVTGGNTLNISAPAGVTFTNNLADDGSISVLTVPATTANYPTNITASVSGNTLTLTWPGTHLGWFLQAQTNSLDAGLTTATNTWFDVAGSDAATNKVITINSANPAVFYRLRKP